MDRRKFLLTSAAGLVSSSCSSPTGPDDDDNSPPPEPRLVYGLYDNFDGQGAWQERQGVHLARSGELSSALWPSYGSPSPVVPWDASDGVDRGNVLKMETTLG